MWCVYVDEMNWHDLCCAPCNTLYLPYLLHGELVGFSAFGILILIGNSTYLTELQQHCP